jgi:hypothetical protein
MEKQQEKTSLKQSSYGGSKRSAVIAGALLGLWRSPFVALPPKTWMQRTRLVKNLKTGEDFPIGI